MGAILTKNTMRKKQIQKHKFKHLCVFSCSFSHGMRKNAQKETKMFLYASIISRKKYRAKKVSNFLICYA